MDVHRRTVRLTLHTGEARRRTLSVISIRYDQILDRENESKKIERQCERESDAIREELEKEREMIRMERLKRGE